MHTMHACMHVFLMLGLFLCFERTAYVAVYTGILWGLIALYFWGGLAAYLFWNNSGLYVMMMICAVFFIIYFGMFKLLGGCATYVVIVPAFVCLYCFMLLLLLLLLTLQRRRAYSGLRSTECFGICIVDTASSGHVAADSRAGRTLR